MTVRILITGSRTWDDPQFIDEQICSAIADRPRENTFIVTHGGASGADQQAGWAVDRINREFLRHGWAVHEEVYLADWKTHGKRAGFLRNTRMVDAGADICLAFIKDNSKGATMCADLAEQAGIPTIRYTR